MVNQFEGMTVETFSYDDFEGTRELLVNHIHQSLTDKEIIFHYREIDDDSKIRELD